MWNKIPDVEKLCVLLTSNFCLLQNHDILHHQHNLNHFREGFVAAIFLEPKQSFTDLNYLKLISPWNSTKGRGDDLELSELATEEHLLNTGTETGKNSDT